MKLINNQRGVALMVVLVLSAISLAIMSALIYMITSSTQISGIQKRYATAYEAGKGGMDVTAQVVALRGNNLDTEFAPWNISFLANNTSSCVANAAAFYSLNGKPCTTAFANYAGGGIVTKLMLPTECWSPECDKTMTIDITTPATYDLTFELGVAPMRYKVYGKIVDTIAGNTGGDVGLDKGGVVSATEVNVVRQPYFYTIELNSQNTSNPTERAKLSVLYEY